MNKEILILLLQKCNLEIYINTIYSNTEKTKYQFEEIQLHKFRKMNDMTTEIRVTFELWGGGGQAQKQTNIHTHTHTPIPCAYDSTVVV